MLVWARPDGRYIQVAGHGFRHGAMIDGRTTLRVEVLPIETDPLVIEAIMAADNLHAKNSTPDELLLADLLQKQQDAGFDLAAMGTDAETLRQMLDERAADWDEGGGAAQDGPTLADRFIVPPFSVLDARQGYWQDRKREWLALGIQSEIGRGNANLGMSHPATTATYGFYDKKRAIEREIGHEISLEEAKTIMAERGILRDDRAQNAERFNAAPGGSPRPAMNLKDGHTVRGDGHGRPLAPSDNGLLGFSEQARTHYGRTFGQDLMRGEGNLTWVKGKNRSDPVSQKILSSGRKSSALGETPGRKEKLLGGSAMDGSWIKKVRGEDFTGLAASSNGTSIFDPVLCELAYSWFCPPGGVILDPFAGGSVRGIVAAKLGRQYVGIDLRAEQVEANEAQAAQILATHPALMLDPADLSLDYTPDLTPVEAHGDMWVKRDDLFQIAGVRGGKVRTVWALAQHATGLVSSGSRHSPHVHRVAAIAQRLGIPCRVHVATGENTPDVQGAEIAGAEIIRHKAGYLNVLNARAREDAEQSGYTLIPFGVVCPEAVKQVSGQVANLPADIKRLVVPVGSGITLAGILQGLARLGRVVPVLGVSVGKDAVPTLDQYAPANWRTYVELVKSPYKFEDHPEETHLDGLPLDPTYEAKCLPYLEPGDCLWSIGLRASAVEGTEEDEEEDTQALPPPHWIVGDSTNLAELYPEPVDFVFTCPPYYDLEVYSDDPLDLSTRGTYEEFLTSYRLILRQALTQLKPNRFCCVVVGDIRDKKGIYRNFVSDTIAACQDNGALLYNEAILVTSVGSLPIRVGKQFSTMRKLGKTHQNVLIFIKGDPRLAVEDCGPVVVHVPPEEDAESEEG